MRNLFNGVRDVFFGISWAFTRVMMAFAGAAIICATPSFAQIIVTPISAMPLALLRFEPPNPSVGQLVTPVIEGTWHNGCLPRTGQMTGDSFRRVVTIGLAPASTICTQAFQPYKMELPQLKFDAIGQYEFQVVDDLGGRYTPAFLMVFASGSTGTQANISGLWYEPATSGSGLFMTQSLAGSFDQIFGAWFYYTRAGAPTWLSFQEGKWQSAGVLVGNIYQTTAEAKLCVPLDPICTESWQPTLAAIIRNVGRFSFTVKDANSAELVITSADSATRKIQLVKQMP